MILDVMGHGATLRQALHQAIDAWTRDAQTSAAAGCERVAAQFMRQVAQAQELLDQLE